MKKNVLKFGLLSGLIVSTVMGISVAIGCASSNPNQTGSMLLGFGSMLVAFAFIFVGIKSYRDKHEGGTITFLQAFKVGALIALISSTMYVLTWLVDYYCFIPDFMEKYVAQNLAQVKNSGGTAADIAKKKDEMAFYVSAYKTPIGVILLSYMEILPLGLIVAALAALIMKRKPQQGLAVPAV